MDPEIAHWAREMLSMEQVPWKSALKLEVMCSKLLPDCEGLLSKKHSAGADAQLVTMLFHELSRRAVEAPGADANADSSACKRVERVFSRFPPMHSPRASHRHIALSVAAPNSRFSGTAESRLHCSLPLRSLNLINHVFCAVSAAYRCIMIVDP